jgi:hypothetical protein
MIAVVAAWALLGDPAGAGATAPVRVCSDMKIDVEGVMFEGSNGGASVVVNTTLKPGACADAPSVAPGDYALHFIERGPQGQSAMCVRRLTVRPGDTVRISVDDGAQCVL